LTTLNTVYIYGLFQNSTHDLFYVGMTKNPKSRIAQHERTNSTVWNGTYHSNHMKARKYYTHQVSLWRVSEPPVKRYVFGMASY